MLKMIVRMCCIYIGFTSSCVATLPPDEQHSLPAFGDNMPDGYALVYEQDFSTETVWDDFEMSDPKTWRLGEKDESNFVELFKGVGRYTPPVRSPRSIALLTKRQVGDFIMELDVESTDIHNGAHRDVCFFLGAKDPSHFYYIHIASAADPNAHNIFLVNDAPRINIAERTTSGVAWGVAIRHRVRIERTLSDGRICVYFNDMQEPIMEAKDDHFDYGHVGFGSFDNTCRFHHFRLYAPESRDGVPGFFN